MNLFVEQVQKSVIRCSTAFRQVFVTIHSRGRNTDAQQYTGDHAAVVTVDFSGRMYVEKSQGESVKQHNHDCSLVGPT